MSLDIEAHAGHHPHKTHHQWVDMVVAFSALFISLVSLGVAILHGRTMENMAKANARLVSANSWPFLSYSAGWETLDGGLFAHMRVVNQGVGPAKIESVELVWKGTAYRTDQEFLKACCGFDPAAKLSGSDLLSSEVVRAGERVPFLEFKQSDNPAVFSALQKAALSHDLQLRVCYCSIFDECWQSDLTTLSLKPTPVQACVQPKIPFDQGLLKDGP